MAEVDHTQGVPIRCNYSCSNNCTVHYIMWRKDGRRVYRKSFSELHLAQHNGPYPEFEDRVGSELTKNDTKKNDTDEGLWEITWIMASEDDLPPGHNKSKWQCYVKADTCSQKTITTDVEYYSKFFK